MTVMTVIPSRTTVIWPGHRSDVTSPRAGQAALVVSQISAPCSSITQPERNHHQPSGSRRETPVSHRHSWVTACWASRSWRPPLVNHPQGLATSDVARLRASVAFDVEGLEESLFQRLLQRLETPVQGWLSVKAASGYMGSSEAAVRQLITRGRLRAYRPNGGTLRLSRTEIDEWMRGTA